MSRNWCHAFSLQCVSSPSLISCRGGSWSFEPFKRLPSGPASSSSCCMSHSTPRSCSTLTRCVKACTMEGVRQWPILCVAASLSHSLCCLSHCLILCAVCLIVSFVMLCVSFAMLSVLLSHPLSCLCHCLICYALCLVVSFAVLAVSLSH